MSWAAGCRRVAGRAGDPEGPPSVGASARRIGREALLARRWAPELAKVPNRVGGEIEPDDPFDDRRDPLRRHIARFPEEAGRDRQPVEDVVAAVAHDFVDLTALFSVDRLDRPPGLDH